MDRRFHDSVLASQDAMGAWPLKSAVLPKKLDPAKTITQAEAAIAT